MGGTTPARLRNWFVTHPLSTAKVLSKLALQSARVNKTESIPLSGMRSGRPNPQHFGAVCRDVSLEALFEFAQFFVFPKVADTRTWSLHLEVILRAERWRIAAAVPSPRLKNAPAFEPPSNSFTQISVPLFRVSLAA